MRTPSLRRRVALASTAVLVTVLLAIDAFLYVTLDAHLEVALDEVLDTRLGVAERLAAQLPPQQLPGALTELGIPASVRSPSGELYEAAPVTPRVGQYVPPTALTLPRVERNVVLPDGESLTVYASRAGVDATLRQLLLLELLGTLAAIVVAFVLLRWVSRMALAPLGLVVDTAERTATGSSGLRLRPDRPHTELGRVAAAYDRMLDSLEAAVRRAEESDERSRRFLADAAHQLRTPVTRMRTTVESMFRADDAEDRDRLLTTLVRETGRTRKLLAALLRVARLDRGGPPTRTPTDVEAICRKEVERAEPFAPHLRFTLRGDVDLPLVEIDEEGVREALSNLLDNARRHAREEIVVEVRAEAGAVRISVGDDGPGVPLADRDRIFERFASLDDKGGSGLGLPIARGVARAHGGDLVHTGRAFELALPIPAAARS
ncbi:HAMP domain-containing sensor histidine kinase [Pseudonocardia broussonetiae]|uniref:histidine kinase n=1 Tax=Pseudonocardia broussonetiae TaxID=2736640 RepID=A0A6M6JM42_9PSEU|nr:HAMP domain-containing sensor histidine kinase [Pseudonocardia broussonetiae]QJY49038.1 HAMP domain-containing histidine kinase [Pseudonocardia broussonetiae]